MEENRNDRPDEVPEAAQTPIIKTTVGKITYLVGIHFKEDSDETLADKIERMIRRDIKTDSFG